jgi:hypothetical protein
VAASNDDEAVTVRKDGLYVAADKERQRLIILHFLPDAPEPATHQVLGGPAVGPMRGPHSPATSGQRVKIKLTTCGTSKFNDTNLTCMRRYEVNGPLVATIEEDDPTVGFRAVVCLSLSRPVSLPAHWVVRNT